MDMQDDRTAEEMDTHPTLVVGTDRFMAGWGKAEGGASYAAWACRPDDERRVLDWVESRSDMKRVRVVAGEYRPSGAGHCHIYVVGDEHRALN